MNFWNTLKKPFFALAPMADVTDAAFRKIIATYGKPDVMWTEFVSADGLMSRGRERLTLDLRYDKIEHPIVAQIFGSNPETIREASRYCVSLGFDGIDINMGCPERNIVKTGSGSGLIRTPELAKEIIIAAKEGSGDIPVSVKTRIGYTQNIAQEWIQTLLTTRPAAITLHGRTRKEMSKVRSDWDTLKSVAEMSEMKGVRYIGNGDISSRADGLRRAHDYGVEGIMIGRAVMGNPWCFNPDIDERDLLLSEKIEVMIEHAYLYEKMYGNIKKFHTMRKHMKAYVTGYPNSKDLRIKLMEVENSKQAKEVCKRHIAEYGDSHMNGSGYFEERFIFNESIHLEGN